MIQRIQSVYLLIAALLILLTLAYNFYEADITVNDSTIEEVQVSALHFEYLHHDDPAVVYEETPAYLLSLALLGFLSAGGAIFLFQNRKLQVKVVRVSILLTASKLLMVFFHYTTKVENMMEATVEDGTYGPALYFSVVAIVLLILAQRAINKDEKLVRSADRIR